MKIVCPLNLLIGIIIIIYSLFLQYSVYKIRLIAFKSISFMLLLCLLFGGLYAWSFYTINIIYTNPTYEICINKLSDIWMENLLKNYEFGYNMFCK